MAAAAPPLSDLIAAAGGKAALGVALGADGGRASATALGQKATGGRKAGGGFLNKVAASESAAPPAYRSNAAGVPLGQRTAAAAPPAPAAAAASTMTTTVKVNTPTAAPAAPAAPAGPKRTPAEEELLAGTQGANMTRVLTALQDGANPNICDPKGRSPLHFSAGVGLAPAVLLLIHFGADMNARDAEGLTPLHMAAGYANPETMKLLIAAGADTTLVGEKQGTALSVVQSLGQYQWEKFYKEEKKGLQDRFKKKDEKLEKLRKCMDAFEVSGRPRTRDTATPRAHATPLPRRIWRRSARSSTGTPSSPRCSRCSAPPRRPSEVAAARECAAVVRK